MNRKIALITLGILIHLNLLANPANLTIKLNGYNSENHKNYADIKAPNINYPFSEQIKISEKGIINTSWLIETTKEIIFKYDGKEVSIIVSPNDHVDIEFEIKDLLSFGKKIQAKTSGINKEANSLIYENGHLVKKWISNSSSAFATKNISELEYQSLREEQRKNQIKKLHNLIKSNKISNQLFIDWATSKINYAAGVDFCLFPFMGKLNKTITEEDQYFEFVNRLNPKNELILNLVSYSEYLETLISVLGVIGNISDRYAPKRSIFEKDSLSRFPIHFKIISQSMSGRQREIALTKLYLNSKNIPTAYIDSLNNYLVVKNIQEIKNDNYDNITLLSLLDKFNLREEEKIPLRNLYESAKGKIILHDFWFVGCPPCEKELPHYNELIERSGDEIEFIFFGVYMEEKAWKEKIEKLNLKGKHYLLTKNQIAFFEKYFKLRGFPHHQIIDKEGKMLNDSFPRVSPQTFESILDDLEEIKNSE